MKLNVAIIEDELDEQENAKTILCQYCKDNSLSLALSCFNNGEEFLQSDVYSFQLVLMDIIFPKGRNGMDTAKALREMGCKVPLVFITKTVKYAINGYEVNALDYIVKPVQYDDLAMKLKKVMRVIEIYQDREVIFESVGQTIRLKESAIIYIEVIKHYISIHTKEKTYTIRSTMKDMDNIMSRKFVHPANSFLVNLDYVSTITRNNVVVGDVSIPITRNYKDSFYVAFNERTTGA